MNSKIGQFANKEMCEDYFKSLGFKYQNTIHGILFCNKQTNEFGEFTTYSDNSVSLLIGKYA